MFTSLLMLGPIASRVSFHSLNPNQISLLTGFLEIILAWKFSNINPQHRGMSGDKKAYHTKATGLAAVTVANHAAETNLQLYGSCFW